jgi:transposase-like protein
MIQKGASMADWKKIKAEYLKGGTSYRKLAEKHGVPFGTVRKVAAKEDWAQLRAQVDTETDTKIAKAEVNRRVSRYERMTAVTDKLLDLVEKAISELQTGELVLDKTVFKQISGTLKDIKDIQSIKSELDIEEQRAKIALLKKQAESDKVEDTEIIVTYKDDTEQWGK